ncbi:TonB family protein [Pontibacter locisalis]|uniref:TonB family protein n=1 Tax=Pontibacter locisalis TaxID=1719035 RepID=A0ABW5IK82_9BACT
MKLLLTLATALLLHLLTIGNSEAQVKNVLYYDADMVPVKEVKVAKYIELFERENEEAKNGMISLYRVAPDSASQILLSKGNYSSIFHPRKAHGQLLFYFPNGKRKGIQTYIDGVLHGLDMEWYENDSLKHNIGYKDGKYDGELKTFYESGKLKREELYKEGKQEYGRCYAEDGTAIPFVPYREMPQFPGGERAMLMFLGQNIRYPLNSQRSSIGGMVVLSFVVNKSGGIEGLRVLQSVNNELDREAMRVVKKMPNWTPGTFEGENVDVRYTLPVRFTIR